MSKNTTLLDKAQYVVFNSKKTDIVFIMLLAIVGVGLSIITITWAIYQAQSIISAF